MRALRRSAFDEEVFGVPFFRVVDPGAPDLEVALGEVLAAHPAVIVDAKSPGDAIDEHERLRALGLARVCTQLTLEAPAVGVRYADVRLAPSLALPPEEEEAHGQAFRYARFSQDDRVPAEISRRLMVVWIHNALSGRREVLHLPGAFVTFADDGERLVIDLVSSRVTGGARRLLASLGAEAAVRGRAGVRVTTEAENCRALQVYVRAGYLPVGATACFHLVRW